MFLNPISSLPGFRAAWIPRIPGVDVNGERAFALRNLASHHDRCIASKFPNASTRHHAGQIHGSSIAVIPEKSSSSLIDHPGVDGLLTATPGQLLAIYVADCAAIFLADPISNAAGLLHSGKKGTELGILTSAVSLMSRHFGTNPSNLVCVVSPCIRPPDYEIDFAAEIRTQAIALGIGSFHDSCENTATDLRRHYSYRIEKGRTGRMLALLCLS